MFSARQPNDYAPRPDQWLLTEQRDGVTYLIGSGSERDCKRWARLLNAGAEVTQEETAKLVRRSET